MLVVEDTGCSNPLRWSLGPVAQGSPAHLCASIPGPVLVHPEREAGVGCVSEGPSPLIPLSSLLSLPSPLERGDSGPWAMAPLSGAELEAGSWASLRETLRAQVTPGGTRRGVMGEMTGTDWLALKDPFWDILSVAPSKTEGGGSEMAGTSWWPLFIQHPSSLALYVQGRRGRSQTREGPAGPSGQQDEQPPPPAGPGPDGAHL